MVAEGTRRQAPHRFRTVGNGREGGLGTFAGHDQEPILVTHQPVPLQGGIGDGGIPFQVAKGGEGGLLLGPKVG